MKCLFLVVTFTVISGCALVPKFETQGNCQGVLKNGLKQGQWFCKDPQSDTLGMVAFFSDGKKDGRVELFYSEGQTESISYWKNGTLNGLFKTYYKNGQQHLEMYYDNGVMSEWQNEWNQAGELIDE